MSIVILLRHMFYINIVELNSTIFLVKNNTIYGSYITSYYTNNAIS